MLKIQRIANGEGFAVIGQLLASNVGELRTVLEERPDGQSITLDLTDLVLADRQAVQFLQECEARGMALHNCPGYVRAWIASGRRR